MLTAFKCNRRNHIELPLHKKWSFPSRISPVNVIKSAANCGFCHIYWRNPYWKTSFFVWCSLQNKAVFQPYLYWSILHKFLTSKSNIPLWDTAYGRFLFPFSRYSDSVYSFIPHSCIKQNHQRVWKSMYLRPF